jgi:hypothetical protein
VRFWEWCLVIICFGGLTAAFLGQILWDPLKVIPHVVSKEMITWGMCLGFTAYLILNIFAGRPSSRAKTVKPSS